jgi:hypothetical protein
VRGGRKNDHIIMQANISCSNGDKRYGPSSKLSPNGSHVEWPLSEYKSHLHTRKFIFRIVMYEDG